MNTSIRQSLLSRRSRVLTLAAAALVRMASAQEDHDLLPLPQWSPEEELAPLLGGLLPQDPQALAGPNGFNEAPLGPPSSLASGPPQVYPDLPSGLQPGDMGLFLPESLLPSASDSSTALRPPTPTIALTALPDEVLQAAARQPPETLLLDPLDLLSEMPRAALERFLEFHARDARVRTRVLLMDRHHRLSESADLARLSDKTSGDTCLVAYPLGEPWRARVFLSRNVHRAASHRYLTEMAGDCISDSLEVSEPQDQLHRFVVRLSTRLFWLEKVMPAKHEVSPAESGLREVAGGGPDSPSDPFSKLSTKGPFPMLLAAAALLSVIALVLVAFFRKRTRARSRSIVWILPEPEIEPRLGGAFSGGAGASASFK